MRLYLIRHCESENNALWKNTGGAVGRTADPGLTELGHKQAKALASFLASAHTAGEKNPDPRGFHTSGLHFSQLYCSLMIRAAQTGTYISRALNMPLSALPDSHERGGIYLRDPETGLAEGQPGFNRAVLSERFPDLNLPQGLGEEGWWNRPYENSEEAVHRAHRLLSELFTKYGDTDEQIAMVTHGGFLQSICHVLFGTKDNVQLNDKEYRVWLSAYNGSITKIDFYNDALRLGYLNYIGFMPAELQS